MSPQHAVILVLILLVATAIVAVSFYGERRFERRLRRRHVLHVLQQIERERLDAERVGARKQDDPKEAA